jgi:hypothetical protein
MYKKFSYIFTFGGTYLRPEVTESIDSKANDSYPVVEINKKLSNSTGQTSSLR